MVPQKTGDVRTNLEDCASLSFIHVCRGVHSNQPLPTISLSYLDTLDILPGAHSAPQLRVHQGLPVA